MSLSVAFVPRADVVASPNFVETNLELCRVATESELGHGRLFALDQ